MRRLLSLIRKELIGIRSSLAFHLIVMVMPLMFLCFWVIALNRDITFPVILSGTEYDPVFTEYLGNYASPNGPPYFDVRSEGSAQMNVIRLDKTIQLNEMGVEGIVELELRGIDRNMTKNYRNRLTGALTSYVEARFLQSAAIVIDERPIYRRDVPWTHFFVISIIVLGILMGSMLFGALSMTTEWSSGTITFLQTSPASPVWILAAKQIGVVLKGVAGTCLIIVVASALVPGIQLPVASILAIAIIGYWVVGLAGIAVGIVAKDPITCFLVALLGSISLWLLGNGFGDMTLLGSAAGRIAVLNPATYLLGTIQHIVNGTLNNWRETSLALGAWLLALQCLVISLYLNRVHMPRGRRS